MPNCFMFSYFVSDVCFNVNPVSSREPNQAMIGSDFTLRASAMESIRGLNLVTLGLSMSHRDTLVPLKT